MTIGLESQLRWGSGFENVVEFSYPRMLDGLRHWRRPAPESRRERTPAGTVSSWVTGRDYLMAGRARWFRSPLWSGGPGLQEFLDHAGEGNTFRFVPDKAVPDFYVDSCVLDEPFENPEPQLEQADGSQAVDLVIRNPSVDFGQSLRGVMFEYAPGASLTDPVAATFARTGVANYRGIPLPASLASPLGASAASGVLRDRHYEGSTRTTLLEAARTQFVTDPENFGAWSVTGTPTLTAGQADPFGGTAAYLIEDNDAGTAERVFLTVTFTADGEKCVAIFFRAPGFTGTMTGHVGLWDNTAAAWRHKVNVTWSAGVLTSIATAVGGGTLYPIENWGGGWYRVAFSATGVVAANTNQIFCGSDSASRTDTWYQFGCNAWNAVFPSSYQGPSLGTRNADLLKWSFPYKPQALFLYEDFVERGSILTASADTRNIGISDPMDERMGIYKASANYSCYHANPTFAAAEVGGAVPVVGDRVEHLGTVDGNGRPKILQAINGGADVASGLGNPLAFTSAFGQAVVVINSSVDGTTPGFNAYRVVKIGPLIFGGITRDTIQKARDA